MAAHLLAAQSFNWHLARQTAFVGIPLAVIAAVLLILLDLRLISRRRLSRLTVVVPVIVVTASVAFTMWRFLRLKG